MTKEEIVEKTDNAISQLVYDKTKLYKAYNYYNCIRDPEQFKFLEENYGIGQPTSVEFIPLIRKHVDALIGEYLDVPIQPKVTCKDKETINNIFREKQLKISAEIYKLLASNLKKNILRLLNSKDMIDLNIKQQMDTLIEDINENFISEYESAGQNVVQYLIQSRNIDLINKLRLLYIDLLVCGQNYYRTVKSKGNVQIEDLDPLNTFPDIDYDSCYIKNARRCVVRKFLSKAEVLSKYGKDLSKEDVAKIRDKWEDWKLDYNYVAARVGQVFPMSEGIRAGEEVLGLPTGYRRYQESEYITVYDVEWIETDKDFIQQRYSATRIGDEIYIFTGEPDKVIRTKDAPERCTLSINGIYYNNRGTEPYSMVLKCMPLQDKYDLLHFYRDRLIASSGTVGDFINLPTLPVILGKNLEERLLKWGAYAKQGYKLIDTSQEGQVNTGQAPLNTMFNGFDDTVKVQAIQAIQVAIDSIEQTTSSITGVFRERLNGIQQRDAVTNVQVGINNSFTITKQWTFEMDKLLEEILTDALNVAKIVYDKGLTGTLILGHKRQKIFTALPKYFTNTDFDIHIITSSEIVKQIEQIKQLVPEFIKGGIVSPDILMDIMTAEGLSDMKMQVNKALRKQKAENNQIQQLTQQLEEAQGQLQQTQQQLQQAAQKVEQLNEAKLQLEQTKMQLQNQVDMYKAKTDRTFKESQAENDTKRTEIELLQLRDGNPYNDEVKNI